jgi:predicted SprT family Zn-dependent metalloprotease
MSFNKPNTDLRKQLYFTTETETSMEQIEFLAKKLLAMAWTINIHPILDDRIINLKERGWTFEFSKAKTYAGWCSNRKKTISVSKHLLEQNLNQPAEWEEVVRHELAHALDFEIRGKSDHLKEWKNIARQVLSTAERCYDSDVIVDNKAKYTIVCDNCGTTQQGNRRTKRVACGHCCKKHNDGKWDERFLLRYELNDHS